MKWFFWASYACKGQLMITTFWIPYCVVFFMKFKFKRTFRAVEALSHIAVSHHRLGWSQIKPPIFKSWHYVGFFKSSNIQKTEKITRYNAFWATKTESCQIVISIDSKIKFIFLVAKFPDFLQIPILYCIWRSLENTFMMNTNLRRLQIKGALLKVLKVSASRHSILRNNILETKCGQLKLNYWHSSDEGANDDWIWAPFTRSFINNINCWLKLKFW